MKVVQCWDDGVVNDIRLIELLRKYGAKATFNLCPGTMSEENTPSYWETPPWEGWNFRGFRCGRVGRKKLYDTYKDFQVASHCWRHETAGHSTDDQVFQAAVDARKFLEDLFQRECRGFAWPCGVTNPELRRRLREAGFAYGRTTENAADITCCADPMALSTHCHFMECNFFSQYQKAKQSGVFYFWGHSYEMFEYDKLWEQFEEKLKFISADPDAEWADVIDIVPLCSAQS